MMRCKVHPSYEGRGKPRSTAKGCVCSTVYDEARSARALLDAQSSQAAKLAAAEAKRPTAADAIKAKAEALRLQAEAAAANKERQRQQGEARLREQIRLLESELVDANKRASFAEGARALSDRIVITAPERKGRVLSTDKRRATAVALMSDWHIEERVDPEKVNGINRYNPTIAAFRMRRFFEGIEWLVREQQGMFAIDDLLLGVLGDIITGYIHEELLEANYMSPTHAVVEAERMIAEGLEFLLRTTALRIRVVCKCGNHGRTTAKLRIGTAVQNSFEWLLYRMLAARFADEERISWQIDEGHHSISEVYGMRIHTHHGDSVRSNGGIGGIDVPLNRATIQWHAKYEADVSMIGHFHRYQHGQRLITNGSGIGYGAYSDWLPSAAPEQPLQAFALIDSKRGFCQATGIWCGDTSAESSL